MHTCTHPIYITSFLSHLRKLKAWWHFTPITLGSSKNKDTAHLSKSGYEHCCNAVILNDKPTPARFLPLSTTTDAASKHATQAFFDCLRAEMEEANIKVTVISPGYIHTNLSVNAVTANGSRYGGRSGFSFITKSYSLTVVRHSAGLSLGCRCGLLYTWRFLLGLIITTVAFRTTPTPSSLRIGTVNPLAEMSPNKDPKAQGISS